MGQEPELAGWIAMGVLAFVFIIILWQAFYDKGDDDER